MCLKSIFKRGSERVADISWLAGSISDLIMVALIADHDCSSISFDTAEYGKEERKTISKHKRNINKRYKNDFVIHGNKISVKSGNPKNLKSFIKTRILSAVPPMEYDYSSGNDFAKRYMTNESYTDKVLRLFDNFVEKVYNLQTISPELAHKVRIHKLIGFIKFKNIRAWQKIFTQLVFNKLQPETIVTDYFNDFEDIKKNLYLFDFGLVNISLIKVENNEIKITNAYKKNKLVLLPYLMIWITDYSTIKFQTDLIYSSICLL